MSKIRARPKAFDGAERRITIKPWRPIMIILRAANFVKYNFQNNYFISAFAPLFAGRRRSFLTGRLLDRSRLMRRGIAAEAREATSMGGEAIS